MWASWFGTNPDPPPAAKKSTPAQEEAKRLEEEAARKEAKKRKAALARKKREKEEARQAEAAAATTSSGTFTVPRSGSGNSISNPLGLKTIREEEVTLISDHKKEDSASNLNDRKDDIEELNKFAMRAAKAQEDFAMRAAKEQENVVSDLMRQANLQHAEDKANAVQQAIEETEAYAEKRFEVQLSARLAEAEVLAVEKAKAEWQVEAARAQEVAVNQAVAKAVAELEAKLETKHEATLRASASLVRKTEVDAQAKFDEFLQGARESWEKEAETKLMDAVAAANLESGLKLDALQRELDSAKVELEATKQELRVAQGDELAAACARAVEREAARLGDQHASEIEQLNEKHRLQKEELRATYRSEREEIRRDDKEKRLEMEAAASKALEEVKAEAESNLAAKLAEAESNLAAKLAEAAEAAAISQAAAIEQAKAETQSTIGVDHEQAMKEAIESAVQAKHDELIEAHAAEKAALSAKLVSSNQTFKELIKQMVEQRQAVLGKEEKQKSLGW